jgi:hypothetical protein
MVQHLQGMIYGVMLLGLNYCERPFAYVLGSQKIKRMVLVIRGHGLDTLTIALDTRMLPFWMSRIRYVSMSHMVMKYRNLHR